MKRSGRLNMKKDGVQEKRAFRGQQCLLRVAGAIVCAAGQAAMGFGNGPHGDVAGRSINNYLVWVNQDNDGRVGEIVSAYSAQIVAGSQQEDGGGRQLNHFWDPDTGEGLTFLGITGIPALDYAQGFYEDALSAYEKEQYSEGFDTGAYHYLGRVIHLIGDMSVPAHVLLDEHVSGDTYEAYMQNAANYQGIPATGIETGDLEHLMRYVAETADDYNSDDMLGEIPGLVPLPLDDTERGMIAGATYPLAIRAAAGVLRNFYEDVQPVAEIDIPAQGALTSGLVSGENHGVHFEVFAHSYNGTFHIDAVDLDYSEEVFTYGWSDITDLAGLSDSATYLYDWENSLNGEMIWLKIQGEDTGGCRSVVHTRSIRIDSTRPTISNATY